MMKSFKKIINTETLTLETCLYLFNNIFIYFAITHTNRCPEKFKQFSPFISTVYLVYKPHTSDALLKGHKIQVETHVRLFLASL